MFNRSRFMLVLGADPVKWAKRYHIDPFTHPCSGCGQPNTSSIPFACGQLRGLIQPACDCGHPEEPGYCFVNPGSAPGDLSSLFPSTPKKPSKKRLKAVPR